jgi:hypothetical protein
MLSGVFILFYTAGCFGHFFECRNTQVNVGPLFNFARYNFGNLPKIEGYLAGVHTDLIYGRSYCDPLSDLYLNLRFDGRWNAGFVCGQDELKSQIKDYRPELNIGYNWCICDESYYLTPLTGIGFYYLSNELKPNIITNRYFNVYVPIGANLLWQAKRHFQVELAAEYRINAWTRLKLQTPDLNVCDKLKLTHTNGVHVEVPMTWFLDTYSCCFNDLHLQCKVVPFFDWNRFGNVNERNFEGLCLPVPELKRWYLGLHVDIGVNF